MAPPGPLETDVLSLGMPVCLSNGYALLLTRCCITPARFNMQATYEQHTPRVNEGKIKAHESSIRFLIAVRALDVRCTCRPVCGTARYHQARR